MICEKCKKVEGELIPWRYGDNSFGLILCNNCIRNWWSSSSFDLTQNKNFDTSFCHKIWKTWCDGDLP